MPEHDRLQELLLQLENCREQGRDVSPEELKQYDEAVNAYRTVLDIDPQYAKAHYGLGLARKFQGKFANAIASFQALENIVPPADSLHRRARRQIQLCQKLVERDKKLPDVLSNKITVTAEIEITLADHCRKYKKRYRDAVVLYSRGFAKRPELADNPRYSDRYNAACAATLAAAGQSVDAEALTTKQRTTLRDQALTWLKGNLKLCRELVKKNNTLVPRSCKHLELWQGNTELATVRDTKLLAALPEREREPWRKLLSEVAALLKQLHNSCTETTLKGNLTASRHEQIHEVNMSEGFAYRSWEIHAFLEISNSRICLKIGNELLYLRPLIYHARDCTYPTKAKLDICQYSQR